jgi:EF hand associated
MTSCARRGRRASSSLRRAAADALAPCCTPCAVPSAHTWSNSLQSTTQLPGRASCPLQSFNAVVQPALGVQMLIRDRDAKAEPVTTEGITRVGFIQLQAQMVVTERLDLVWRMLFMFGYDRSLSLDAKLFANIPEHSTTPVRTPFTKQTGGAHSASHLHAAAIGFGACVPCTRGICSL